MRQESLFEGFAVSSAGARGLMQIMPATGQEIATQMNWPEGYSDEDLYRPEVSIPMGRATWPASAITLTRIYATLAAYNGGPGNTIISGMNWPAATLTCC
jgi:soluble lytic murein transglycosylase